MATLQRTARTTLSQIKEPSAGFGVGTVGGVAAPVMVADALARNAGGTRDSLPKRIDRKVVATAGGGTVAAAGVAYGVGRFGGVPFLREMGKGLGVTATLTTGGLLALNELDLD